MNRTVRSISAFIITLLIMMAVPIVALATDVSVTTDSTEVKAGDTVTLTITVTAENIGVASGSFTYDPALLTYVSSDGGASDGYINMVSMQEGGASSLSAVIKFTAKTKGAAAVNVSIDKVLSYDEQVLETGEGETSIKIAAADAVPQTSDGESENEVDFSQTGVAAQNVTGAETQMYVWRDLSSLTIPSGFAETQVTYVGEQVGGAVIPDSEDIILLYLSEAAGENGGYYIYNEQENTLNPYITITSQRARFSIIWPDENVTAPAGFEETTLEWDDKMLPAWKTAESGEIVYLVYARNYRGEMGFYLFNTEDESVQRYAAVPAQGTALLESVTESTEKPVSNQTTAPINSGITIDRTLFIGLCIAVVLILVAAVVFATLYMKRSRSNHRRVARMKERMETEVKEKQTPVSPLVQTKEQKVTEATRVSSLPKTKSGPESTVSETKEKHGLLVIDANLSDYTKNKEI